ncbi:FixH family protein [Thermogemmatispora carboxidivorans]|uniref:FixH family protein n=1 Tax=Thermogemmatispora carboxidivorans TaxID=1382306 RepID=UPI00069BAA0F|nr:FixH family protein [Thermogemmatispora carboxidivorans]
MRRNLLVILLGLLFLALLTWLGGLVASIPPPAPAESGPQQAHAGLYEVTLQLSPDPPLSTQPTTILLRIAEAASGSLVNDAHVQVESTMPEMNMGLPAVAARLSSDGLYRARLQFAMSGLWQLRVTIQRAAHPEATALFQVTTH